MKNKLFCFFFILLFCLIGVQTISLAATTSDAVSESYHSMKNKYGQDYNPPFITSQDEAGVDPGTGAVSITENLVNLPGKNGLDLVVDLQYLSSRKAKYYKGMSTGDVIAHDRYYYYYYISSSGRKVNILIDPGTEHALKESFEGVASNLNKEYTTEFGKSYYKYDRLRPGSYQTADTTFYLDKSLPPYEEEYQKYYDGYVFDNKPNDSENGWNFRLPHFVLNESKIDTPNEEVERPYTGSFMDETGAVREFTICIKYLTEGEYYAIWMEIDDCRGRDYSLVFSNPTFNDDTGTGILTHEKGFKYNFAFRDDEGKIYYLVLPFNSGTRTQINAIEDRYGNMIVYNPIDGGGIIDTYGRRIKIDGDNNSGSVKLVENGAEQELVRFEQTRVNGPNDPNQILRVDDTYVMTITRRESETQDIEDSDNVTVYKMSMHEWDAGYEYNDTKRLDSITYPTGAQRFYTYEKTQGYIKPGEEYRVVNSYLTVDGETKNPMSYAYTKDLTKEYPSHSIWSPDYTTEVTYDGLGTDIYTYDKYDRLTSVERYKTDDTEEYFYEEMSEGYDSLKDFASASIVGKQSENDGAYACEYEKGKLVMENRPNAPAVTYSYHRDYADLLTDTTTQRDAEHLVEMSSTMTSDGKSIAYRTVKENGEIKGITYYQYDQYGNVTEEKATGADGTVLSLTKYAYTYNSDGSSQVKSWVENVKDADGNTAAKIETVSEYDKFGRLVSATDANGNTTTYTYDLLGRVLLQTNSDGTNIEYVYDTKNNIITITNENGNQERHNYSPTGLYESVEVKQNNTWRPVYEYSYDEYGRKVGETEYRSSSDKYSAAYTLDKRSRITTQLIKNAAGETVSLTDFSYDAEDGAGISLLDIPLIESEGSVGDGPSYVEIITKPVNTDTAMAKYKLDGAYDYFNVTIKGDDDDVPFAVYGDDKLLLSGKAMKRKKDYTLNVSGIQELTLQSKGKVYWREPILYVGPMLVHKTTISPKTGIGGIDSPKIVQYSDHLGQIWRETVSNVRTHDTISETENRYDRSGNLLTTTTGEQTTSYEYNYQNQPVKVTNPEGNSQTTEYDALGRTVAQTDFIGNTTEIEYDTLGRQIVLHVPFDGETKAVTKNYYDANGNVTKTLVQDNAPGTADSFKKTEYTYDVRNRLVSAAVYTDDNTPNYTQYKYDNVGNTTAVYTGLSAPLNLATAQGADMDYAVTQYAYNELNQPVTMTDALGQTTTYKYDYVGNVTQMTDRNGTVTNVEYNLWGAPVVQSASKDGITQTITNTYDQLGLLRSATDENGTTTYDYDAMGRLTEEEIGDTINSYSYDMYGNRTSYTLTRGGATLSATSYTYDNMNRLATMTNGGVTTSYTYDANGQVLTEQGGGYSASYTYNDGGLLTAKVGTGAAGEVLDVSYSHALDGNILQKNDEDEGVTTYAYDGAGRLISEVNGQANVTNSYSYDAYGNRTGAVLGGTAVSYTYDKNNRLTKESATAGGAKTDVLYQYDPNGNRVSIMTSKTETEQADAPGISLELPQLETALNRYDAFGRLVESEVTKDGALTNTTYTYNASGYRTSKTVDGVTTEHLLDGANVAADVANGQVTQYVRGLGLTALVQSDGTRLQYVTDGHGDVKKLISGSGAVVADYTYDAFGNQTGETEDSNPFRYAGEYWDSESGLIYLRARYYDSGVGGFVSEDPARDGENWYSYCGGNPILYVDPSGMVLRIIDGNRKLYATLQKLTDDELQIDDNGIVTIKTSAGENSAHQKGTELVRRIIYSGNTINVTTKNSGKSSFEPTMSTVYINYEDMYDTYPTYDGDGTNRSHGEGVRDFILLGHELIHAEHYLRGPFDTTTPTTNTYVRRNGEVVNEEDLFEELRTVGPIEWEERHNRRYRDRYTGDITENDLRWEHGIALRSGYNW